MKKRGRSAEKPADLEPEGCQVFPKAEWHWQLETPATATPGRCVYENKRANLQKQQNAHIPASSCQTAAGWQGWSDAVAWWAPADGRTTGACGSTSPRAARHRSSAAKPERLKMALYLIADAE